MKSWGIVSAKVLLLLFFGVSSGYMNPLSGQEIAQLQKPLQHEVAVTLKLIQVYVTDKNGKPVIDLTKDDFILYDDGKPQKLTEFEKHFLSLPAPVPAARAEERVVQTPVPPSPRLLNRKFFLFFDFAYNNPPGVRKMGEAARHFLDTQVLPSDEVGVLSYSILKLLQINLNLTTDHRKVRDLVSKIGLRDSNQRFEDSEDAYQRKLAAGNLADARPETKTTLPMPEFDAQEMWRLSARTYIDCLTALAWALRSIQGQKNLILFSEGIPYPIAYSFIPTDLTWKYENMLNAYLLSILSVPFDPSQYAPYLERTLYRESEALAVIRCAVPEGSSPKLKLTAFLFDKLTRDHIPMALTVLSEKTEKAARTFFVRMAVPDVEPDEYTLFLVAEDEASGARSEIACDFAVEDAVKKGGLGR